MATASHLRRMNQRRIIGAMMRVGSASRAQLAKEAGMSQATVGRIVDDLLSDGILAERSGSAATGAMGRPSTPLELDRTRKRFLAVQVGVRQTRLAALPVGHVDVDQWEAEFETPDSPAAWGRSLVRAAAEIQTRGIEAVVLSLPGVVDERSGRVLLSPNLRWTHRADFAKTLRTVSRAPVVFVQEIRALALGHLRAEPELQDFLLVDFGSGVGAAVVIAGKLYDGSLPLSGELGHTPVPGNPRPCGCGAIGCVETLVSRGGLLATARPAGVRSWEALVAAVQTAVPEWLKPSLDAAATTISGALNVMGLQTAVISGSLADMPAATTYLGEAVQRGTMWERFGHVVCKVAPRRRMAGMVSAAIDRTLAADS